MNEILYYPVIDCDTEGSEKVAMIPTVNAASVRSQSRIWLAETVPHYFRLHAQSNCHHADAFNIRCPRCGKALKRIGEDSNQTTRGLYVCSACVKK